MCFSKKYPGGLNLNDYENVKYYSGALYLMLKEGVLPCEQKWTVHNVRRFKQWIDWGHFIY